MPLTNIVIKKILHRKTKGTRDNAAKDMPATGTEIMYTTPPPQTAHSPIHDRIICHTIHCLECYSSWLFFTPFVSCVWKQVIHHQVLWEQQQQQLLAHYSEALLLHQEESGHDVPEARMIIVKKEHAHNMKARIRLIIIQQ